MINKKKQAGRVAVYLTDGTSGGLPYGRDEWRFTLRTGRVAVRFFFKISFFFSPLRDDRSFTV